MLIQHQLVLCDQFKGGSGPGKARTSTLYRVGVDRVLWRARFPRYIHAAKEEFGDVGEVIVEYVLQQGHSLMSEVREVVYSPLRVGSIKLSSFGHIDVCYQINSPQLL